MSVDWNYYDGKVFETINNKYLPIRGEGDSIATQAITAINKLIYKWYNDGDVYDNTGYMNGWFNDISSYANWLYENIVFTRPILIKIFNCTSNGSYEDLLKELADKLFDYEFIEEMNRLPKNGSIYKCDGPFQFIEYEDPDNDYEEDEY